MSSLDYHSGLQMVPVYFKDLLQIFFQICYRKELFLLTHAFGSETIEEHLEILRLVLERLKAFRLRLRLDKCYFAVEQINYWGYRIKYNEIRPGMEKTVAIKNFPIPENVHDVRRFLGLTGYFRKFMKGYSTIAKPLTDLTKSNVVFKLGKLELNTMDTLKQMLTEEPILKIFDYEKEIELHTDASKYGLGAILLQRHGNDLHPVFYASWKTLDAEQNYHSFELETLAVIKALEKFRIYLLGKKFKLVTDCAALQQTLNKKELNRRINRWALQMQEFEFETEHRKAERMQHVDCLSRMYGVYAIDSFVDELSLLQDRDSEIKRMKEKLETGVGPTKDYKLVNGKLMKEMDGKLVLVVPAKSRRALVLKTHEDIAHLGVDKTVNELRKNYHFKNMRKYVKKCLSHCLLCAEHNHLNRRNMGLLHSIDKGSVPWDTLHIDHLGPLEKCTKGFKHVFAIIDSFSKFIFLEPTKTTGTEEAIKALANLFKIFGSPWRIICDRGTAFTSNEFKSFCQDLQIDVTFIAVQTPRSNGQIERYNRTILPALLKLAPPDKWHKALSKVQMSLNKTIQSSTGKSPSEVLFGYQLKFRNEPEVEDLIKEEMGLKDLEQKRNDIRREVEQNIKKSQERNEGIVNKHRKSSTKYGEGDYVMIQRVSPPTDRNKKMASKFVGPYMVAKVLDKDRYVIEDIPGHQITQKPYVGVLPPERMKLWIKVGEDPNESSDNDESDVEVTESDREHDGMDDMNVFEDDELSGEADCNLPS